MIGGKRGESIRPGAEHVDDDGVFGCMSLLGCHDVCPKELPLQTQIAFIRRKMVKEGMS